ncbi:MAG: hypothetical protein JW860_05290 [Sedimentisphaerales bacterium]|nr:hypothetical protein [Sedimentisphaerales bacterium]
MSNISLRQKWQKLIEHTVQPEELASLARQIADSFIHHHYQNNHYKTDLIDLLCEMDTHFSQPRLNQVISSALFRTIVEELCDDFEANQLDTYNRVMAQVVSYFRRLPQGRDLDDLLNHFGLHTQERLLQRARRIQNRLDPFTGKESLETIFILSRITLGADIAIVSVILQRLHQAFPQTELVLFGSPKSKDIFGGNPWLRIETIQYPRYGSILDRFECWQTCRKKLEQECSTTLPERTLLLDPDSRITQLGMLPLVDDHRYFYFNSHTIHPADPQRGQMAGLVNQWMDRIFTVADFQYPRVWLCPDSIRRSRELMAQLNKAGCRNIITINFGVGGNDRKRVGADFEIQLVLELLKQDKSVIILDRGFGPDESARTQTIVNEVRRMEYDTAEITPQTNTVKMDFSHGVIDTESDIGTMAGLIGAGHEFIGYDSACQHISAAQKIPTITLFMEKNSVPFIRRWSACGQIPCTSINVNDYKLNGSVSIKDLIDAIQKERTKRRVIRLPVRDSLSPSSIDHSEKTYLS